MKVAKQLPTGNSESYYVKYHPEIQQALGSEKAAILMDRLEYWFQIKPEGFYKFYEPCKHPLYRPGDSWLTGHRP